MVKLQMCWRHLLMIFFIVIVTGMMDSVKKTIAVTKNDDEEGECPFTMVASKSEDLSEDDQYVINRVYHTKTFKDGSHFHRRIIYICDRRGDIVNNVALLQCSFEEEERDFDLKPHGNSKDGS